MAVVNTVWGFISGVFNGIRNVIAGVINWIRANWPLLLAILVGPFGLAVLLIVRNWNAIVGFFARLPGMIAGFLSRVFSVMIAPFLAAWNWIQGNVIAPFAGAFGRVVGGITSALSGVFNAITAPFRSAWNWIQSNIIGPIRSVWNGIANTVNGIHFSVKIPSWVPGIGGKGFDWQPHLPTLDVGGLVTRSGLAYIHAAEVVSPIPPRARLATARAGTVNVNMTVNVPATANPAETGRAVAGALRSFFAAGGRLAVPT
jgi:hypothetical protein